MAENQAETQQTEVKHEEKPSQKDEWKKDVSKANWADLDEEEDHEHD